MTLHGTWTADRVGRVNALAFTLFKGKPTLAGAGNDGMITLWDLVNTDAIQSLNVAESPLTSLTTWPAQEVIIASGDAAFADDSLQVVGTEELYLYKSGTDFERVEVSRYERKRERTTLHSWTAQAAAWHPSMGLLAVALSPDGETVATGSRSGEIRVWKLSESPETAITLGHREPVTGLSWNPDGSLLASAGAALRIWEPDTRISRILTDHTAGLTGVQFSPDGTLIATSSQDNTVRIWGID